MPDAPLTRRAAAEQLRQVIDPEVGLNIVDLGLIYDVQVEDGHVAIALTMTTPACPMSSYITQQAKSALGGLPAVQDVHIELVWYPAWHPVMIDPEARRGLYGMYR